MGAFVRSDSDPGRPNVRCELEAVDVQWLDYDDPRGATEPVATRTADGWRVRWCWYDLTLSGEHARCRFVDREAGLEHALRACAVFTTMPARGLYVHAATLVVDGEAVLFAGHPNAGKSTISREGGADAVLSNEISILAERDGRWFALPSPFWGTGDTARRSAAAPLAAVAVLRHARDATSWEPLSGADAVRQLSPHIGVQARAQWDSGLLQAVSALTMAVPCFDVAWLRGSDPFLDRPWKP